MHDSDNETLDLYADEIEAEIKDLYADDEAADVWSWANEADNLDLAL